MAKLFLPFTNAGKRIELAAIKVKRRLGLTAYDSVDPFEVLDAAGARLLTPEDLSRLPADALAVLSRNNGDFSAVGLGASPVTGLELILMNRTHHLHRQKASLMEEVVHLMLEHPRTVLSRDASGHWSRSFDEEVEEEALAVGAACIIPYRWLFRHLDGGGTREQAAREFGVSQEFVRFRIQRAGLFRLWKSRTAAPA